MQLLSWCSKDPVVLLSGFVRGRSAVINVACYSGMYLAFASFIYVGLVTLLGVSPSRNLCL